MEFCCVGQHRRGRPSSLCVILYCFLLFLKVIQLTCPVCISYTETLRPKVGLTSHPRCLSTSPTSTLSSTSHISPGEILALYCVFVYPLWLFLHPMCGHRYWLWYTTQRIVCGTVRKVYQKLKQFKVQFLVLQRKTDPSQVILQCLPSTKVCCSSLCCRVHLTTSWTRVRGVNPEHMEKSQILLRCAQVDHRVQSLAELYDGPQPSDMCDLLEGEQFFAGFERGLDISTGLKVWFRSRTGCSFPAAHICWCPTERPDCVEGRLCFVFYSSLKNLKEVYICAVEGHTGPVRGQVRRSQSSTNYGDLYCLWPNIKSTFHIIPSMHGPNITFICR